MEWAELDLVLEEVLRRGAPSLLQRLIETGMEALLTECCLDDSINAELTCRLVVQDKRVRWP